MISAAARRASSIRCHFSTSLLLALIGSIALVGACMPTSASAYATIEGPPTYSSAPGLPDGRVYELVSPANKNGNEAGATTDAFITGANAHYGYATAEGNSVFFEGTGPMGESPSGASLFFVATKNKPGAGWSTRAALPAGHQTNGTPAEVLPEGKNFLVPSSDLAQVLVRANGSVFTPLANTCPNSLYLAGSDPLVPATWLEQPQAAGAVDGCENYAVESGAPVGGTPDFSTVYFAYAGTLLPEDASRAPHAARHRITPGGETENEAWGFYEYREGSLHEAGVLPNGSLSPFGAVPAASGRTKARFGNEVSEDGERAFFVSPDPSSCEQYYGEDDCMTNPPQLYVRENGQRTVLVSRDVLLPDEGGLPTGAPDGPSAMPNTTNAYNAIDGNHESYVFASPDGAQAFFQSESRLTGEAPEGTSVKTYDFNVEAETLSYLPGVEGKIVATDKHGSALAFVRPEVNGAPAELDLWTAGPDGGTVTPVTQLPGAASSYGGYVSEARLSEDGSVLVFTTGTRLSSSFNSGNVEQIYRFDAATNALGCISCAPAGVEPNGDASMSSIQPMESYEANGFSGGIVESRGISANGERVFFDTPTPLVQQDTNTNAPEVEVAESTFAKQGRDVYEWENGVVYLISGGKSPRNTYYLDSSENGDDVFFATTESLVQADTDGGYDVYDARVPQPSDNPPAQAVPCEGQVCQGPPRKQAPLAAPASASFSGLGNPVAESVSKSKTGAKQCGKDKVRRKGRCVRQPKKSKHKRRRAKAKRSAKGRK